MTILNLTKDVKGFNTYGRVPAENKYSATITAAGGEQTLTLPIISTGDTRWLAIFSYEPGSAIWISLNATAATPAGVTFAASTSELNPVAYELKGGDIIHFITSDVTAQIGISLYVLQQ